MMKTATIYAYGSKESTLEVGDKLGLTGDALHMFSFAGYEVKLTLEVDTETGLATITHVDDRKVAAHKL